MGMKKKILLVFGTRPEAIKMCPLVIELQKREQFEVVVCVSAQHREMLDQVLEVFGIVPNHDLDIMRESQTLFDITCKILKSMEKLLDDVQPDLVLVHGDTTTAFASALAAFYKHIRVGHVEAGLRTYDLHAPFPEEWNRQAIGLVGDYHFAPTEEAKTHLCKEGKRESSIFVTGNTGLDALKTTVQVDYTHPILTWSAGSRLLFVTAHRRENLGEPMRQMFAGIRQVLDLHQEVKAVYPVHPNPQVQALAREAFSGCENMRLIDPLDVIEAHNLMANSYIIVTDSGGIQEEAVSLNKPVLVMRESTEREEGVKSGAIRLVGNSTSVIAEACIKLLENQTAYEQMCRAVNPFGDGDASKRIADILQTEAANGTL